jgi:hypothetical protein
MVMLERRFDIERVQRASGNEFARAFGEMYAGSRKCIDVVMFKRSLLRGEYMGICARIFLYDFQLEL